ncbi:endolytic transglycosylase MltG [Denitromonas sp.]|uniref:endolytic transglycosylase MltG n=1 Tax=Denitromonas sp. TaxID=2734609 RepID=UPI002AFE3D04|nr:endolytic transglycosylase MltG [Denitromonas sp.]
MKKRLILLALVLPVLVIAAAAASLIWYVDRPLTVAGERVEVQIARGASMRQAANAVADGGVAVSASTLYWFARIGGHANRIKAGTYAFESGVSPRQIVEKLVRGDVVLKSLALIEGWTFRQVRAAIDAHPDLQHDSKDMDDAELLRQIGASETHPEGLFFPDTYHFERGMSDLDVYRQAYAQMQSRLTDQWEKRAADLPLKSPYEALILASIVEKETGQGADRPLIASVFINRLRVGMLLQTDPTVIYGVGPTFDGNLRRRDLERDTPYNTYTRPGLPPTPIAMPGHAAIEAALNPAASDFYYFVARGDGSSEFSKNLSEHNRAVRLYQLSQRGKGS